jgi:small subunit ribosomal protein S16
MALRIRMRRISRKATGRDNFRIVVTDQRNPRDSKFIEEIGHYDPTKNPASLKLEKERYDYWVSKGAQPTETVASLYKNCKE